MNFTSLKTTSLNTNNFRLFRSTIDRKLFAVHLVDTDENSLMVCTDGLTFDEAQDALESYKEFSFVNIEEVPETSATIQSLHE